MEVKIVKIDNKKRGEHRDIVADEVPLTIHVNGKELVTFLCSPCDLRELSVGFLYSSGLIKFMDDIENITIDNQNWISHVALKNKDDLSRLVFKRLYTSGCGKGTLFYNSLDFMNKKKTESNFKISQDRIVELINIFQKGSVTFNQTGGSHSAALSNGKDILVFKEDIGRHNAVDKVIGEALIRNLSMRDFIILSSGRISSEIIFKVQKSGAAFIISRAAPTNQAIRLARECNLTLVGFVRGQRMNIYSSPERVI